MKYTLLLFACFAIFQGKAQPIQLKDSSWVTNTGGVFYEHRYIEYMSGESNLVKKRLGDTLQVLDSYKNNFTNQTNNWANDIEWTSTFSNKVSELARQDIALTTQIGRSPIKAIVADNRMLADSTFKVKESTSPAKTINFTINAAGALRYKIDTFTTRAAICLGSVIRLSNYLNQGDVVLYKFRDGRWRDATRTIQVYLQSEGPQGAQNREFAGLPADVPVEPLDIMRVYDGGIILTSGKSYKWSASKKQWVPATLKNQKQLRL